MTSSRIPTISPNYGNHTSYHQKTRTTIVISNGRYTFYQIHFIKPNLSNTIYPIPFIKNHLSNTIYQIPFIKYHLSNILYQIPFIKYHLSNTIYQIPLIKYHLQSKIFFFLMNESMNEWINQPSVSRTAYLPLKINNNNKNNIHLNRSSDLNRIVILVLLLITTGGWSPQNLVPWEYEVSPVKSTMR